MEDDIKEASPKPKELVESKQYLTGSDLNVIKQNGGRNYTNVTNNSKTHLTDVSEKSTISKITSINKNQELLSSSCSIDTLQKS